MFQDPILSDMLAKSRGAALVQWQLCPLPNSPFCSQVQMLPQAVPRSIKEPTIKQLKIIVHQESLLKSINHR